MGQGQGRSKRGDGLRGDHCPFQAARAAGSFSHFAPLPMSNLRPGFMYVRYSRPGEEFYFPPFLFPLCHCDPFLPFLHKICLFVRLYGKYPETWTVRRFRVDRQEEGIERKQVSTTAAPPMRLPEKRFDLMRPCWMADPTKSWEDVGEGEERRRDRGPQPDLPDCTYNNHPDGGGGEGRQT